MSRLSDTFILGIEGTAPPCDSDLTVNSTDKTQDDLNWGGTYSVGFTYIVGRKSSGGAVVDGTTAFSVAFSREPLAGVGQPTSDVNPPNPATATNEPCEAQAATITGTLPDAPSPVPTRNVQWTGIVSMAEDTD